MSSASQIRLRSFLIKGADMKKTIAVFIWFALLFLAPVSWNYPQLGAKEEATRSETSPALQELDIVMVLDNSGSMKANDPKFLTREVVTNFMVGFGEKSRLAIIIFDQEVRLVEPLADVTGLVARANFMKSLDYINYKGLFSDIPAAIERAVYELKLNGRINARKVIILLTDGIVDTGDKAQDLEKTKWLKEDLAQECSNAGIRIFGVAFTDKADFSLIQTLAFKTEGEYFRAYTAEDIRKVFDKINNLISKVPSGPAASAKTSIPAAPPAAKSHRPPAAEPVAAQQKIPAQPQKPGSILLILLIGVFVLLAVIVVIMALNRKTKASLGAAAGRSRWGRQEPYIPRAELIDVKNVTDQKTMELSKPLIRIGRDTSNDVAIPTDTVSSLHATIEYRDGFFYLEDQRSKNKTYLNGDEIAPYSPKKLKSGDVITINVYKFIFILPDLIPAGETVLDLRGGTGVQAQEDTIIRTAGCCNP